MIYKMYNNIKKLTSIEMSRITFLLFVLLPTLLQSANIHGVVRDINTREVLSDVNIHVLNSTVGSISRSDGHFSISSIESNQVVLRFERIGYKTKTDTLDIYSNTLDFIAIELEPKVLDLNEEIVITARRFEQYQWEQPEAVTVLNGTQWQSIAPRSTAEAFFGTPGIWMQKTNHGGGSPFIRGLTGNQVLILIDGIRLNNATFRYGPNQYLNTISPEGINRVEVVRGSGSVLYGSDAIGGVTHLITKDPLFSTDGWRTSGNVALKYMTEDMEKGIVASLNTSGQHFAMRASLARRIFSDLVAGGGLGKQSPSGHDEWSGDAKMRIRFSHNSLFTAAYQHLHQNDVPRYDQVAQRGYVRYSFDPQVRQLAYGRFLWFQPNSNWKEWRLTISWQRSLEGRKKQKEYDSIIKNEEDEVKTVGLALDIRNKISNTWQALSGIELYYDYVTSEANKTNVETGEEEILRGLYPNGSRALNTAFFTSHRIQLERFLLSAGLRYNYIQIQATDKTFGDLKITPTALVGQFGMMYHLKKEHHLGFTINNAFRAPNINDMSSFGSFDFGIEVPSNNLSPEKSITVELNYKITLPKVRCAFSLYHTQLFDLITRVRASYQGSGNYEGENVYKKQNTANAYVRGAEFEAELAIITHWQLKTYLIYTYGQNTTDDEPMRRIPPLNGRLALRYLLLTHWIEWENVFAAKQDRLSKGDIDDHRITNGGTPGWWIMNIRGGYQIGQWRFITGLLNLFNEAYRIHGSGVDGYGRSGYLQVGFGW